MKVKVAQSCLALCDPHGIVHGILHARILGWLAVSFFRGSSEPSEQTQVSHIVADSLPVKPPGKPKNTGMGSLFLLKLIFLIKESNQGLLYCRRIFYHLSY